jgi:Fe-S-cluster-containing dehydrogenase component
MKKCTLCVDRIYNDNLPAEDREPACVRSCPANARHFGDLADPQSEVSVMVAARGGVDLMPEQGNRPVNKYLPPRPKTSSCASSNQDEAPNLVKLAQENTRGGGAQSGFLGWLDSALSRM